MNRPVAADHDERIRALDLGASIIVQAPAGSGKTELLIQRYLKLLAHVENPEEIVAITFTNKAAAEMRGRVMKALAAARTDAEPQAPHARETWTLARAVLARDDAAGWQLPRNPGRLRIQTVDSFCAFLTRQMPLLSRLGAQPETLEDAAPLYREAAARTLALLESGDHWSDAVAALLTHLDNDLPRVRDLLAAMLRQRDQWLRHVVGGVRREELEGALARLVESSLAALRREFPPELVPEFLALADGAARHLAETGSDSTVRHCAGLTDLPPARPDAMDAWRGIVDLLLTKTGGWRRRLDVSTGFPAGKGENAARKERMTALIAALSGNGRLLERLGEVRYLPPVRYEEAEWQIARALSDLLVLAAAQLRVVFGEHNRIDFSGIAMAAGEALEEEGAPTDLALHLDYRIAHLLVDEFQDISINQHGLLQRLTAGWQPGDGRTLFLVGDPMQSIYRFREAEVGKFLETWQRGRLGAVDVVPLRIRVNFRSRAGIVDWVNAAFRQVLPPTPDVARGAVDYAPAEAFHAADPEPAVIVHGRRVRDDGREAGTVVEVIRAEQARDPAASIAILVRGRNHLADIVPALQQAGLRYRAVDIEPLGERPAVQDLLALTRALLHGADRIAWLALLRAPWCGLTLEDLARLVEDAPQRTVWACLQDESRVMRLDAPARSRLGRLRAALHDALARQGRVPLHRNVEAAWLQLGGPATVATAADLDNARAYLDLLAQHAEGGDLRDVPVFLEAVDELHAAPDAEADGTLQIITMHKAKGLEFDVVILPGLGRAGRGSERELMIWDERAREDGGADLLLAPIRAVGADEVPLYRCLQYFEQERESYEEGRLLYVAATRAKRRLHLLGSAREDKDGELLEPLSRSPLRKLWPVVAPVFETLAADADGVTDAAGSQHGTLRRLPANWISPAAPDAVAWKPPHPDAVPGKAPEFEWAGETAMHVGTVYHRAVWQIAEQGRDRWDAARVAQSAPLHRGLLRQLGVPEAELDGAVAQVRDALVNTLEDERGRWILAPEQREARNEFAISGLVQGRPVNAIIDRTFVDTDGTRWIIDYKTGRHEGGDRDAFLQRELERYAEPLARYTTLLSALHGGPVRAALYYPVLRVWLPDNMRAS